MIHCRKLWEVCDGFGGWASGGFSALDLRALARRSGDAAQVRRLLALAVIYAGGTRRDAALAGGVGLARLAGLPKPRCRVRI